MVFPPTPEMRSMADAMTSASDAPHNLPSEAISSTVNDGHSTACTDEIESALPGTGSTIANTTTAAVTSDDFRGFEEERSRMRSYLAEKESQRNLGSATDREFTVTEAEFRALQLKREEQAVNARHIRRNDENLFKNFCSTDLLFLIDTTGSMAAYISAAKQQVLDIVNNIETLFFNEANIRMAVVGYKDHSDSPNIQFLDFTANASAVRNFISKLVARGGGDTPEDVLGGLRRAINASWTQQNRCIIHIADSPPHSTALHDMRSLDNYPKAGSEPHHLTHDPLLKQMTDLKLNYALMRINGSTDKMAYLFHNHYVKANADCSLYFENRYSAQAKGIFDGHTVSSCGTRTSARGSKGELLFEEMALGTNFDSLRHLVVKVVGSSASRTAVRLSGSSSGSSVAPRKKIAGMKKLPNLGAIGEDEEAGDATEKDEKKPESLLERGLPQWRVTGWLDETVVVEGFSPALEGHNADTLNDMMAHDDNINMTVTELTVHKRSKPFAQGSMRLAYYAGTPESTNRFVVKAFKKTDRHLTHLAEDMRCQALCKAFALEFNALVDEKHSLDFMVATCLRGQMGPGLSEECWSLEPYIDGKYVKYNSNVGYVNEEIPGDAHNEAAQAFSHFSFERSNGSFLVSDMQGVGNLLTDPVIHTADSQRFKLMDSNFGPDGFKFFFSTHKCNDICKKLKLLSSRDTILNPKPVFRQDWPKLENTVCCSNKLCAKVLPLASAKTSAELEGYNWCSTCWPQLNSSHLTRICPGHGLGSGTSHGFEVSPFFYESQGMRLPRKCAKHREKFVSTFKVTEDELKPKYLHDYPTFDLDDLGFGRSPKPKTLWRKIKNAVKKFSVIR